MRQISLQGHRGARGLLAENTLPSLAKPFEYGMDGIEFDIQLSKDNQVVIYHDLRLKSNITRKPDGKWVEKSGPAIRWLNLKQLREYKLGIINKKTPYGLRFRKQQSIPDQAIPTLAELIEHQDKHNLNNVLLNIEIKHSPLQPNICHEPIHLAKIIVEEIHQLGISKRCIVQCFNWSVIKAVRQHDPSLPISCLTTINSTKDTISPYQGKASLWNAGLDFRDFNQSVVNMVVEFGADYWSPYYLNLTKTELDLAHKNSLKVMTWTVNHKSSMKRLMNWGVDGIISDYPNILEHTWNQSKSKNNK